MPSNYPIVLIHGYSDTGSSFDTWKKCLQGKGHDVATIFACSYRTLTNEVTIRDLAEGLDRALRLHPSLANGEPFSAIVHSTGMLVLRSWLAQNKVRRSRLKHLIGLAPASFGSPLAHKGRSWLGSLLTGSKNPLSPDFLEAGDRVLDGLELASRFTWDLAHEDILADPPMYGENEDTPYVFIFAGVRGYSGIRAIANEPGTDGVVRWAGCALGSRKIVLDLTRDPDVSDNDDRIRFETWRNSSIKFTPISGVNHSTIISNPTQELIDLVDQALRVSSAESLASWHDYAEEKTKKTFDSIRKWQQFVFRALDERGDPITDYHVQLFATSTDSSRIIRQFDLDVHTYGPDSSLRCFHVQVDKFTDTNLDGLQLEIRASSGSGLVGYYGTAAKDASGAPATTDIHGSWTGQFELSRLLQHAQGRFFYPFTTTLVELRLNREPLPLDPTKPNQVLSWLGEPPRVS